MKCPWCGSAEYYALRKRPAFNCKICRRQFSATSGTPLHSRKLPLERYETIFDGFRAGKSNLQVARENGINPRTAWRLHQVFNATKQKWESPSIYEVLALPPPWEPSQDGWYDASTAPHHVWIEVRRQGDPYIHTVAYEHSDDQFLWPWVTRNRKLRIRWDEFDLWQNKPGRRAALCTQNKTGEPK